MTFADRRAQASAWSRTHRPDLPLRIVLAHDLSPGGDRAAALVAAARWAPGTTVRVITSPIGLGTGTSAFASTREVRAHHRDLRRDIALVQDRVAAELIAGGLTVQTALAEAPPGDAVIAEADAFDADLIVVGAREQGPIAATVLGSVSARIMDGAGCSVLVSRGPPVERVVLATDGSLPARLAMDIVADWPIFASAQIRVLGIGSPPPRYPGQVLSPDELDTIQRDVAGATKATMSAVVGEAVDVLIAEGRDAEGRVRTGDPHSQIVAAARDWRTDLVVIGATGQSPLKSILLGSVARRILHRVSASVLVARPRARDAAGVDGDRSGPSDGA